jgi:ornithine carbamoyltransferase
MPYQVNSKVMAAAKDTAIFLHCLPAFHDLNTQVAQDVAKSHEGLTEMEVTDEVFRSLQSKVFDQAENRMHTIKAIMLATLK